MPEPQIPPTIKQVLGEGWMKPLAQQSGVKDSGTLSRLVNLEYHTSKHWLAVLTCARRVNPVAFAAWAAANPDKLLAGFDVEPEQLAQAA